MSGIDPQLQVLVDDAFPEVGELFAAGEAVELMATTAGWQALRKVIGAELRAEAARLSRGRKALDQADYALAHGRLGGLQTAYDLADAIVARAQGRREEQAAKHENAAADAAAER